MSSRSVQTVADAYEQMELSSTNIATLQVQRERLLDDITTLRARATKQEREKEVLEQAPRAGSATKRKAAENEGEPLLRKMYENIF
ncbi:hypothetical protein FB451DRAFT_1399692 [Mycena latifolia]|nr:hypothetical protein FB451DRAFT_1399692 [Mycena latifolia]